MKYFKFIEDKLRIFNLLGPLISRAEVVSIELDGLLSFAVQCVGEHSYSFNYDTKAERDEDYNRMYQWFYGKSSNVSKEIDWEQRRYEIAKDILATSHIAQQIGHYSYHEETEVKDAVMLADALISELKKKQ